MIVACESSKIMSNAKVSAPRYTILIVDDNRDMREYLYTLMIADYNVVTAVDGLDAEKVLIKYEPDIVVTDLMMPRRDGIAFIESIRAHEKFALMPIIMLTAKIGQEEKLKGLQASADEFLEKPFDERELKIRIKNLLNRGAASSGSVASAAPAGNTVIQNGEHSFIQKMRTIMKGNIGDCTFNVEELAKALYVSSPTLRRKLGDISDYTPSEFIRHCRLERASQLISEGNIKTLEALAHAVGFARASVFSGHYQKTFSVDPVVALKASIQSKTPTLEVQNQ